MRLIAPSLLLLFTASLAYAGDKVLIYNGTGVCQGCPDDIADELRRAGYQVAFASAKDVTPANLKKYDLYIQPGGDDVGAVKKALKAHSFQGVDGFTAIQNYVKSGGHYLGLCLGAFMADSTIEDDHTPNLYLLSAETSPHLQTLKARIVKTTWQNVSSDQNGHADIYFQGGPQMKVVPPSGLRGPATVLATYDNNGAVAAVMNDYGEGRAMALGVHPEAKNDWLQEDHIPANPASTQRGQSLFLSLVAKLLATKPAAPAIEAAEPQSDNAPAASGAL